MLAPASFPPDLGVETLEYSVGYNEHSPGLARNHSKCVRVCGWVGVFVCACVRLCVGGREKGGECIVHGEESTTMGRPTEVRDLRFVRRRAIFSFFSSSRALRRLASSSPSAIVTN
jgi:hypothetical protein